jgi:amphi-Trp domain-containing protein
LRGAWYGFSMPQDEDPPRCAGGGRADLNPNGRPIVARKRARARDVQRNYPTRQFIAKLRRLADCLEQGRRFQIRIAGERVSIPSGAAISLEHERGRTLEEVEFQLTWSVGDEPARSPARRRRPRRR